MKLISFLALTVFIGVAGLAQESGFDEPLPETLLAKTNAPQRQRGIVLKAKPKKKEDTKKPDEKKSDEKAFADIIKDYVAVTNGLFTLYRQTNDPTKLLIELGTNQVNTEFLFSATQEKATGERGFYSSMMGGNFPFYFRRVGKQVQWVIKNPTFTAAEGTPAARMVRQSFGESVAATVKVLSAPHPERKSILVDAADLLLTDFMGYAPQLNDAYKPGGYRFDKGSSWFGAVKAFPENVLLDLQMHYVSDNPKNSSDTLPDARSIPIVLKYEFSVVRNSPGFQRRPADERVGHFLSLQQDFTSDREKTPYKRYIHRWNLEKADTNAAVSAPKQPITFWLENTIPKEYRAAFRDGVLLWNSAFERIGFKDAVVCKEMPDDADWDPADTRYNVIRWFAGADAGFAIGPSRANPFTGELYDADIGFSEVMVRGLWRTAEESVEPLLPNAETKLPELVAKWRRGQPTFCTYASDMIQQAAFASSVLATRPEHTPEATQRLVHQYIVEVVAHEVGHTLGLRHNFRASTILPPADLMNTNKTHSLSQASSVMDYNPIVVALPGETQGDFVPTRLGPYDLWVIEYAYKPLTPGKEEEELKAIAGRAGDALLGYATDEDALGTYSPMAMDPYVNQFDASGDPLGFEKRRVALVKELWAKAEAKLVEPGEGYQVLRRVVGRGFGELSRSAQIVAKFIGGVETSRARAGDVGGRLPLVPVPAVKQREALEFLTREIFNDEAFKLPSTLLAKLGPERMYGLGGLDSFFTGTGRLDYPWHGQVLGVQQGALYRVFNSLVLARVLDNEVQARAAGQEPFTMAELFGALDKAIWSELDSGANAFSSTRRNLQREHVRVLLRLALRQNGGQTAPEDATTLARASLTKLARSAKAQMAGKETTTAAHLEETASRIDAALSAQMFRSVE
jgi:hypothetical protein